MISKINRLALDLSVYVVSEELDINMEPPSNEELDKAISLLKRNKAPGIDNITSEILKDGGEVKLEENGFFVYAS